MPGWAKALIIVAVLMVLLVVGVIAAGTFWWSRNKDTLIARGKAVVTEGKDAGRKSDNQGCVDQSISSYKKEPGLSLKLGLFCGPQGARARSREPERLRATWRLLDIPQGARIWQAPAPFDLPASF